MNWSEFFIHLSNMESKIMKGLFFEVFCFHFLSQYSPLPVPFQNIWLYKDVNNELKNRLNLPHRDKGTDILIENQNPNPHAEPKFMSVQCKFVTDTRKRFNCKEIATFHLNASQLGEGLLISTQQRVSIIPVTQNCVIHQITSLDFENFQNQNPVAMSEIIQKTFNDPHILYEAPELNRNNFLRETFCSARKDHIFRYAACYYFSGLKEIENICLNTLIQFYPGNRGIMVLIQNYLPTYFHIQEDKNYMYDPETKIWNKIKDNTYFKGEIRNKAYMYVNNLLNLVYNQVTHDWKNEQNKDRQKDIGIVKDIFNVHIYTVRSEKFTTLLNNVETENLIRKPIPNFKEIKGEKRFSIATKNGFLINLSTGDVRSFQKEDFITKPFNCMYEPFEGTKLIYDFLSLFFSREEDIKYLLQQFAVLISRHKLFKVFGMWEGTGDSGKDALYNLLINFMGNNFSYVVPESILTPKAPSKWPKYDKFRLVIQPKTNKDDYLEDETIRKLTRDYSSRSKFLILTDSPLYFNGNKNLLERCMFMRMETKFVDNVKIGEEECKRCESQGKLCGERVALKMDPLQLEEKINDSRLLSSLLNAIIEVSPSLYTKGIKMPERQKLFFTRAVRFSNHGLNSLDKILDEMFIRLNESNEEFLRNNSMFGSPINIATAHIKLFIEGINDKLSLNEKTLKPQANIHFKSYGKAMVYKPESKQWKFDTYASPKGNEEDTQKTNAIRGCYIRKNSAFEKFLRQNSEKRKILRK